MLYYFAGGRVVSIGITPWGTVEKRHELVGKKMDVPFHSVAQPRSVSHSKSQGGPEEKHKLENVL